MGEHLQTQCVEPADPNYGGFIDPQTRFADGRTSIEKGQEICALYLMSESPGPWPRAQLREHVVAHLAFLRRSQYEDGSIDLNGRGIGTGPEVGFVLPSLCETYRRFKASSLPERTEALETLESFIRRGAETVRREPALTANHRWAACAGPLAVVQGLFPDLGNRAVIDDYLADGIDLNVDGLYYEERSPNYNTVANWGLILLADHDQRPELLGLIRRNLEFALRMRQPNGEAETLFSHRQDRGKAGSAFGSYYISRRLANETGDGVMAAAADELLNRFERGQDRDRIITPYHLIEVAQTADRKAIERKPLPDHFVQRYDKSALWRMRCGTVAATVAADPGHHFFDTVLSGWGGVKRSDAVMSYQFGDAVIASLKLLWAAGVGGLRPETIEHVDAHHLRLSFTDPGWDHVAHFRRQEKRAPRRLPVQMRGQLDLEWQHCGEMAIRIQVDGWERVPINLQLLLREHGRLIDAGGHETELERRGRTFTQGVDYILAGPDGQRLEINGLPESAHELSLGSSPPIPGQAERRCHRLIVGLFTPVDFRCVLKPVLPPDQRQH